jgi:hypothetical protein
MNMNSATLPQLLEIAYHDNLAPITIKWDALREIENRKPHAKYEREKYSKKSAYQN